MTIYSHVMTMEGVKISDLKARLSEHLRRVRRGHVLTVLDRDRPVARLVPYEESATLRVREPAGRVTKPSDVPIPPPVPLDLDVVELLLEERQGER